MNQYIKDIHTPKTISNRIGLAKGKFSAPDNNDFDATNDEVIEMMSGSSLFPNEGAELFQVQSVQSVQSDTYVKKFEQNK